MREFADANLTPIQLDILKLKSADPSVGRRRIADMLDISMDAARYHLKVIERKLREQLGDAKRFS